MLTSTGRRSQPFSQSITKPTKLPPEANPWWWNPGRLEVEKGPNWFRRKLEEVDPGLEITWNRYGQHWSLWMRKERLQTPICQGWSLLFHIPPRGLDNSVLARLYSASADKWGNAKEYFRAVEDEIEYQRRKRDQASRQETIDIAMETFDYSQIKNIGKGNKFATYHQ